MLIHEITQKPRRNQIDEGLVDQAKNIGQQAVSAASTVGKNLKGAYQKNAPGIKQAASNVAQNVKSAATPIAKKAVKSIGAGLKTADTWATDKIQRSGTAQKLRSVGGAVGNIGKGTGNSPREEYQLQRFAEKAMNAWTAYTRKYAGSLQDPAEREKYTSGKSGLMNDQLTDFVERNLLGGKTIESLANAAKIYQIIDTITGNQSTGGARKTRAGFEIISTNPMMMRKGGQVYKVDDKGGWTMSSIMTQGDNDFLDQQAQLLDPNFEPVRQWSNDRSEITEAIDTKMRQLFVDLVRQTHLATAKREASLQYSESKRIKKS